MAGLSALRCERLEARKPEHANPSTAALSPRHQSAGLLFEVKYAPRKQSFANVRNRCTHDSDFPAANVGNADGASPTVRQLDGTSTAKFSCRPKAASRWHPLLVVRRYRYLLIPFPESGHQRSKTCARQFGPQPPNSQSQWLIAPLKSQNGLDGRAGTRPGPIHRHKPNGHNDVTGIL